jgi:hypothetical protein
MSPCSKCGSRVLENARSCWNCGFDFGLDMPFRNPAGTVAPTRTFRSVARADRMRWLGPVIGFWLLGCFIVPLVVTPQEHGSIFIIQPAFFVALAGAFVHCVWVCLAPARLLSKALPACGIAVVATGLASWATALFWHAPLKAVIGATDSIGALILVVALLTAIAISKLYIKRKIWVVA